MSTDARQSGSQPKLSIVVVAYDMARELPRTLQSLTPSYQRDIVSETYEVILVDNGSPTHLGEDLVSSIGSNFRYHYIQDAKPSPAAAANTGVALSGGAIVCIMIDGARLVTPGLIHYGLLAFRMFDDPIVEVMGWHLGPEKQQVSVSKGYNQEVEDQLLDQIQWPQDGYRLYEIASPSISSSRGWFAHATETNAIFMRRETYNELGGYDTAFDGPGGELVNLDFYCRACERENSPLVRLIGEGTFHQFHGGVSSNLPRKKSDRLFQKWAAHYKKIRGYPYVHPTKDPVFLGTIPPQALRHIAAAPQASG
ncbi:glycosyltransferase family 2 protein [Candidatus Neomarinimicrobiota bacterium]